MKISAKRLSARNSRGKYNLTHIHRERDRQREKEREREREKLAFIRSMFDVLLLAIILNNAT